MIECRPIRESETETFLNTLCEVFDLDSNLARPVFYRDPGFDLKHKWAAFESNQMVSILTISPLMFGDGPAVGIAGVATPVRFRSKGFGRTLVRESLQACEADGIRRSLLFAERENMYSACGFEALDEVVEGVMRSSTSDPRAPVEPSEIVPLYAKFIAGKPEWLVRTPQKWAIWQWMLRVCEPWGESGYVCHEGAQVREVVPGESADAWPVGEDALWIGLESVTRELGVPCAPTPRGMKLMGRGWNRSPKMFMTDQF